MPKKPKSDDVEWEEEEEETSLPDPEADEFLEFPVLRIQTPDGLAVSAADAALPNASTYRIELQPTVVTMSASDFDHDRRSEEALNALLEDVAADTIVRLIRDLRTATGSTDDREREGARRRIKQSAAAMGVTWLGTAEEERKIMRKRSAASVQRLTELVEEGRRCYRKRNYKHQLGADTDPDLVRIQDAIHASMRRWQLIGGNPRLELIKSERGWKRLWEAQRPDIDSVPRRIAAALLGVTRFRDRQERGGEEVL